MPASTTRSKPTRPNTAGYCATRRSTMQPPRSGTGKRCWHCTVPRFTEGGLVPSARSLSPLPVAAFAVIAAGYVVLAQSPGPQPVPMPPAIVAPADVPYPGTIQVRVDATDIDHRIFTIHETIPVRGGQPTVLLYPEWWPGHHSPVGRADMLAGLVLHAGGKRSEENT